MLRVSNDRRPHSPPTYGHRSESYNFWCLIGCILTGADLNNPYSIIYSTGPDVITEAAFPLVAGQRTNPTDVLVVGKGQCFMNNRATGTWIGDEHPAWDRSL